MKIIICLASFLLAVWIDAAPLLAKDVTETPASPREDIVLNVNWRFIQADPAGAESPQFDDASWKTVLVPHCWNIKPGQDGDVTNFYLGSGWYRLHLKPAASTAGQSLFLKFDAAYHSAEVFLNGKLVGTHVGGFGAFCFDVTGLLHPGQDNLLSVRVSYKPPFPSIPLAGDYTRFPGLYRDVHLLVLDPVSISPMDDASSGVYLKQVQVDDAVARVEVTTKLRNGAAEAKHITVRCRILDATGMEVQKISAEQNIPAHGVADNVQTLTINRPHLWNGRQDPYLYQAEIEVVGKKGITDRVLQPLGLRYFAASAEQGFTLNGKPYAVHGVCRHQDRFNKGWAISRADMEQDMSLLLEMGCTGVRLAHYPHSEIFHELCDKAGLIVWAELPLIGGGWLAKDINDPGGKIGSVGGLDLESEKFRENARQQLTELIKQNYNHPSIVFWSIWNEISSPKSEADKEFLSSLNHLAKELDPSRLTTAASADDKNKTTEVVGRNAYFGWYGGSPDDLANQLPLFLARANGRPLIISEYGAGASVLQHQNNPGRVTPKGMWHPEEWQAVIHEKAWKALSNAPYLCATFAWVGFDLASIIRNEGDHPGRNDKGLITADRSIRKDAFYFYKANWNPDPMVYITSRRFTPRPAGVFPVKVYSNCAEVELMVNGQSQGVLKKGENGVFVWEHVTFPEGDMRVEVKARHNGKIISDQCVWKCSARASDKLDLSGRSLSRKSK